MESKAKFNKDDAFASRSVVTEKESKIDSSEDHDRVTHDGKNFDLLQNKSLKSIQASEFIKLNESN